MQILTFDTSALNALSNDTESAALVAGINAAYRVRLCGSSVDEILATQNEQTRNRLLSICPQLLAVGDCTWPFNWIVEKLIAGFERAPGFDWKALNVRSIEYEDEISRRETMTQEFVRQQHAELSAAKRRLAGILDSARPTVEASFAAGAPRPQSFREFLQMAQGTFWYYAGRLYKRGGGAQTGDQRLQEFVKTCPPFQAMVLAAAMFVYGRCVRGAQLPESRRADRLDILMAIYLPYCDLFVTNDRKQEACLRDIASEADIDSVVVPYNRLRDSLASIGTAFRAKCGTLMTQWRHETNLHG